MYNGFNGEATGQETLVTCLTSGGTSLRATGLRLNRHTAAFEVFTPQAVLQSSEVLTEFKITVNGRTAYDGRATIKTVINSDTSLVCEATLGDAWIDVTPGSAGESHKTLRGDFAEFLRVASHGFKILPEFKLVVADMQTFLLDLRQWLDQVKYGMESPPASHGPGGEREALALMDGEARPLLARLFERFEAACARIDPDLRAAHAHYVKRQLHPLVLCAPFMYRSFHKPLGYAGDYQMINMMVSDPFQGDSAYAKVLNSYFLSTPPVVAHRNRVACLSQMLQEEVCRSHSAQRPMKVLNLGCGPALEIQEFLANSDLSNRANFTLLDFNDETIEHVSTVLQTLRRRHHRSTVIQCQKKSVVQVLKETGKASANAPGGGYEVIYCAGLFDYLTDSVCQRLMATFYSMLAPGGLLVVTNVFAVNPSRQWMDYSVDWHLIYRDRAGMAKVRPPQTAVDAALVESDLSGLNLFLKVRKPADE
jgi:extracellular factor (EF) 3-hydroxypalmitic acid methyl ester biosynthesis protein